MILGMSEMTGLTRATCLDDAWKGAACMLVGGAPTIAGTDLSRLSGRGIVSAAINNAAKHFRPMLWFSGDNPGCYDRIILTDPGILKFAPSWHMDKEVCGLPMKLLPAMFFYVPFSAGLQYDTLLDDHRYTPWAGNTLMVSLHILYRLGFRTIVLHGCDFEPSDGRMYAHDSDLTPRETEANIRLYASQAETLVRLKPVFVEAGLSIMDCSSRTKLKDAYATMTFDEAVDMLQAGVDRGGDLPHGTRFAPDTQRMAAGVWEPPPRKAL